MISFAAIYMICTFVFTYATEGFLMRRLILCYKIEHVIINVMSSLQFSEVLVDDRKKLADPQKRSECRGCL